MVRIVKKNGRIWANGKPVSLEELVNMLNDFQDNFSEKLKAFGFSKTRKFSWTRSENETLKYGNVYRFKTRVYTYKYNDITKYFRKQSDVIEYFNIVYGGK